MHFTLNIKGSPSNLRVLYQCAGARTCLFVHLLQASKVGASKSRISKSASQRSWSSPLRILLGFKDLCLFCLSLFQSFVTAHFLGKVYFGCACFESFSFSFSNHVFAPDFLLSFALMFLSSQTQHFGGFEHYTRMQDSHFPGIREWVRRGPEKAQAFTDSNPKLKSTLLTKTIKKIQIRSSFSQT